MSKIIISDDQNIVQVDGKKYVAEIGYNCSYCDFDGGSCCVPYEKYNRNIPCMPDERIDKESVIFKLQK